MIRKGQEKEDFAKLDKLAQQRIYKYLKRIEARTAPKSLGEQLEEKRSAYWKYRAGDYWLITELKDDVLIVLMLMVLSRFFRTTGA